MATGIHTFEYRPPAVEVQAAIWYPEDDFQRTAVLAWLLYTPGLGIEAYEYGAVYGGLHLHLADRSWYAAPGDYVVMNPVTKVVITMSPNDFAANFTYAYTVADPNQPALF